jgi:hypothetical protein
MVKQKTPTKMYLKNCASDSGVKSFFSIGRVHSHSISLFIYKLFLQITIPNGEEAEDRSNKNVEPLSRTKGGNKLQIKSKTKQEKPL